MSLEARRGPGLEDLPNIITVLRMLSVVPLVWLLLSEHFQAALWLAFVAGASDGIDGFLAKRFGWTTRLGGLLDPLADKLLLIACYAVLTLQGQFPEWLLWLVVGRDVLIVAGASAFHYLVSPVQGEPSLVSKLNTFLQIVQVLLVLLSLAYGWSSPWLFNALVWAVAATTVASGAHYVTTWSWRAWIETRKDSKP